jgi:glutamate-1-semialdehyde aminotransferase
MKHFKNELGLAGCQDCPRRNPDSEKESCCASISGALESSHYEEANFNCQTYDKSSIGDLGVGITSEMKNSEELWAQASGLIPGGGQTFSKSPMCFVEGVAPKFLERGKGSRVWDVDGNQYIDYVLGCFPMTLGYANDVIDDAIKRQLQDGITFSMMHRKEVELASRLEEIIPCAEMSRFAKNGSDATTAAVRLARAVTKRDRVICFGYHGFKDWYIGTTDRNAGVPEVVCDLTTPMRYNQIDHLKELFDTHKGEIACLIMEPTVAEFPKPGYLEEVKEIVHANGALLVFDEMLTGFRFDLGGAQAFFGIEPDLAAFGKGLANGMPIGVLVGKEKYMKHFEEVFFSSTYGGEALSLAAAVAGIDYIRENDVIRRLWKSGLIIFDNFTRLVKDKGMSDWINVVGYPVRNQIVIKNKKGEVDFKLISIYQQEMFKRGILCYPGLGFSSAHTDEELMHTVFAFGDALDVLKKAIEGEDPDPYLEGNPIKPVFRGLREQRTTSN